MQINPENGQCCAIHCVCRLTTNDEHYGREIPTGTRAELALLDRLTGKLFVALQLFVGLELDGNLFSIQRQ